MRPILSAAAMRRSDERTIHTTGIPGFTLMESAGRASALHVIASYPAGSRIVILCGKGNNGGDGFVCARYLTDYGYAVQVLLFAPEARLASDAREHFDVLIKYQSQNPTAQLHIRTEARIDALPNADLYIDALLGTGLRSALRDPIRSVVAWLYDTNTPVIALDIPTGLHTDTGQPMGLAVRACETLCMGAIKTGLLLGEGPFYAGKLTLLEIGIPRFILDQEAHASGSAFQWTPADTRKHLPVRKAKTHKYEVGQTLVVAGSPGLSGAAVLAARAAARIGSGAVVCACPHPVRTEIAGKLTEVMTLSLPYTDGRLDPEHSIRQLETVLQRSRAVLIGPGMGRDPQTQETIRKVIAETTLPVVIDADGLRALAGHMDWFSALKGGPRILTPHLGEFKSLTGDASIPYPDLPELKAYSKKWNAIVLMKGLPSIVATPDGRAFISDSSSPSLATAGSGDVLAGTIAGLIAQGVASDAAAPTALHIGGWAARLYAQSKHPNTLLSGDLLDLYPQVLHDIMK